MVRFNYMFEKEKVFCFLMSVFLFLIQPVIAQDNVTLPIARVLAGSQVYQIGPQGNSNVDTKAFLLCPNKGELKLRFIWKCFPEVCPNRYAFEWPDRAISVSEFVILIHGTCPYYLRRYFTEATSFSARTLCSDPDRHFELNFFSDIGVLGKLRNTEGQTLTYAADLNYVQDDKSRRRAFVFNTRPSINTFQPVINEPSGAVVAHTPTWATIHFNVSTPATGLHWEYCIMLMASDGNHTAGCFNEHPRTGFEVAVMKSILPDESEPQIVKYQVKIIDKVCGDSVDSEPASLMLSFENISFSVDPEPEPEPVSIPINDIFVSTIKNYGHLPVVESMLILVTVILSVHLSIDAGE